MALTGVASLTLYERFTAEAAAPGRYRAFVDGLLRGDLVGLLGRHPVLGRMLDTLVHTWVESNADFLRRLAGDSDLLATTFGSGRDLGRVTRVRPGLSDRHGNGGTVTEVTFSCGAQVIYKPRGLAMESGFYRLLAWLNGAGCAPHLRILDVVDRETHGWMEHARHEPCPDQGAVARYYRRAGMLLCVAYVLQARDLHFGNVLACAEHPVLVDTEVLFHPFVRAPGSGETSPDRYSVMETGLLPDLHTGTHGGVHDRGGAGGSGGGLTPFRVARWADVNTDAMALRAVRVPIPAMPNVPVLRGRPADPGDYVDELIDGFRSVFRLLLGRRDALSSPEGPLAAFAGKPARVLLRSTPTYTRAMERALRPELLRSAAEHRAELGRLLEGSASGERSACPAAELLEAEVDDLERLDVPRFTARTDGSRLELGDGSQLGPALAEAGLTVVRRRLGTMDEREMEAQVGLIRAAYLLRAMAQSLPPPEAQSSTAAARLFNVEGDRLFPFGVPRG